MNKYLLTSKAFVGSVVFGYRDGILTLFENDTEMTYEQIKWCAEHLPTHEEQLEELRRVIKGSIQEVPPATDFDTFWQTYGKKINKKRCEPLWKKLTEADRALAIMSVRAYDGYLKRSNGRAKMDPENYLRKESFRNEWNSLQY